MEEQTLEQRIDELTDWLENNEIDDPDYPENLQSCKGSKRKLTDLTNNKQL